jgi:hypothetical protein
MLKVVSVGDERIGRIIPGGEVAKKSRDDGDRLTAVIEEFHLEATILSSTSLNRHAHFSLSLRKMDVIMVRGAEETAVPVASAESVGVTSRRRRHQRVVSP